LIPSENQCQQADNDEKADQEDHTNGPAQKFQHEVSPFVMPPMPTQRSPDRSE
jgi:hypothetical protein